MQWHVKITYTQWYFAEYWLEWNESTKTLIYKGEGQNDPKDLWGFESSFPPKILDDDILSYIAKDFGAEVHQKILELTGYTSNKT